MAMSDNRFCRLVTEIRDRMNAQCIRILNEDVPEENSILESLQVFRQQEGARPYGRRRGTRPGVRPQQVTFKVLVLRSNTTTRYSSRNDATEACRVVVPLDLSPAEFRQARGQCSGQCS
ncbi:hypothetical protein AALO_G00239590 [Alosa alosa]|uniref:Transposase n=1 Tax=Alosa alosa TaxID=278164 RepID=A0AAV6FZF1_9TELE|nr:hypothetical protein AALO_G00239590 [Alosa alosa]